MTSAREIEDLIEQIDATPYGRQERELLRTAIDKAVELGDIDLEYRLRMRQTSSAFMSGDTEAMLSAFTWCLGRHDADPARFPYKVDNDDLLWHFKWMAEVLLVNPRFGLDRVDATVADMQRRYEEAGVGMSGVWQAKFSNALDTGRLAEATEFRARREETPEDDYSHCDACVRSEDVAYFRELGDIERALDLFDEIIDAGYTCGEEPERVQGHVLLTLLRSDRIEDAERHHRQGLRFAQASAEPFPLVLPHLPFLAVTGNLAKGLSLLEQYLPHWTDDAINLRVRFQAACAFAVLLDALVAAGHGSVPVRGSSDPRLVPLISAHEGLRTTSELACEIWSVADALATQFDERNGTPRFARLVAEARALADEHYDLPLSGPISLDVDAPAIGPKTAADHLNRARLLSRLDDDAAGAAAELTAGLDLDPQGDALIESLTELARAMVELNQDHSATLHRLVAALRAADRHGEADLIEAHGATLLSAEPGLSLDDRADDPDPRVRALVLGYRFRQLLRDEQPAEAKRVCETLVDLDHPDLVATRDSAKLALLHLLFDEGAEPLILMEELATNPQAWIAYLANLRLAQAHGRAGRFADGAPAAARAVEIAARFGVRGLAVNAAGLAAQLHGDLGAFDDASAMQRVALRHTQLGELPGENMQRFQLGRWLVEAGRTNEAADEFEAAARIDEALGEPPASIGYDYLHLAMAARGDDPGRAYSAFMRAIELADQGDDAELRVRARLTASQFLLNFEDDDAVDLLERALADATEAGIDDAIPVLRHTLGRARCQFGDGTGLDDLDTALALETERNNAWAVADITDSSGRALLQLDRFDEGIAKLLTAADLYAEAGDVAMAANAEMTVARALREASRAEDAVAGYEAVRDRLAADPDTFAAVCFEFADYLDELGEADRASQVRAEAGE